MQQLHVADLAAHDRATILQVEILDVQRENLRSTRRRLVEQSPQRLLPDRYVPAAPQPVDLHVRDRARAIRRLTPALDTNFETRCQPATPASERHKRARRRDMPVPRRRRAPTPHALDGRPELVSVDITEPAVRAELHGEPPQGLGGGPAFAAAGNSPFPATLEATRLTLLTSRRRKRHRRRPADGARRSSDPRVRHAVQPRRAAVTKPEVPRVRARPR